MFLSEQIDEVLKEGDRAEVLGSHVDQLLLSMSMQIKMVYSTHMSSDFTSKDDVTRLYRCLLGTLLAVSIINSSYLPFGYQFFIQLQIFAVVIYCCSVIGSL